MKVTGVVLAAGLGTRLRPSTNFMPKPLIPVAGIEPLFFAIDNFRRIGIKQVIVNAFHLPEQVEAALKAWAPLFAGMEFRCEVERGELLGTGGGLINIIHKNSDWFKDAGLLVQNGDTLACVDLSPMVATEGACRFAVSFLPEHLKKYNPLWVSPKGAWSGIGKTPPQPGDLPAHFLGVHLLSKEAVQTLRDDSEFTPAANDLFNAIYRPLADRGHGIEQVTFFDKNDDSFWFDMTTPSFLLEAQKHVFHANCFGGLWTDLLKRRYPGIYELRANVWVTGARWKSLESKISAPAILVDHGGEIPLGLTSIGPDATMVIDGQQLAHLPRSSRNSVVVLGRGSSPAPAEVENQVLIV